MRHVLFFLLILLLASPAAATSQKWTVLRDKSSIIFEGKQMGTPFKGSFDLFTADILFNPDDLAQSTVKVSIDMSKINTHAPDRDEAIRGKDWFDVAKFPYARFETIRFRKTGDKTYEADANLTIRDVTLPITLPFTLNITKGDSDKTTATMDASIILDRSKFNLGGATWADTSVIGNEVPVTIHLTAAIFH